MAGLTTGTLEASVWLGSVVVRVLDLQSTHCWIATLGKSFRHGPVPLKL